MARKKMDSDDGSERRKYAGVMECPPCERIESHTNTRIIRTRGKVRSCICDDCGHQWNIVGPFADALREYANNLSDSLRKSPRQQVGGQSAVVIADELAKEMAAQLRKLAIT